MIIKTREDLKLAYEMCNFAREKDLVAIEQSIKKDIRNYFKKQDKSTFSIKGNDLDYLVFKIILPAFISSQEAAIDYFENIYFMKNNCAYDCTGKPFTIKFLVTKQGGRWVAYHIVGHDF